MKTIPLRCYAEGDQSGWEAFCIDLDISVHGRSFEEVHKSLETAIAMYIEGLNELPEADRHRLIRRKAPLSVRLRHALAHLLYFTFRRGSRDRHDFTASSLCPS